MVDVILSTHMIAQSPPITKEKQDNKEEFISMENQKKALELEAQRQRFLAQQQELEVKRLQALEECGHRAYLQGLAVGPISSAGIYLFQKSYFKGTGKAVVGLSSVIAGLAASYFTVKIKSEECDKTDRQKVDAHKRNLSIQ